MNTRGVIGRTIVAVHQRQIYNSYFRRLQWEVERVVLDDGTCLVPHSTPTEDDASVDLLVVRPKSPAKKGSEHARQQ